MAEVNKSPASLEQRRPLSPHLQIYRPMLTMMMSITHRITGAALYFGTLLLAWYLIAAAGDAKGFATAQWFFGSPLGLLILFGYTLALFIHLLGGVRHAIWDTGRGFDPKGRELLAQATLVGGVALTVLVWVIGFMAR
jgi:succinate dehydrogenase / fumarate reductase cytochrome b subunit